jgi:hypothetical protein
LRTLQISLRDSNYLDKNYSSNRRLTIIILTDGGLTEAAGNRHKDKDKANKIDNMVLNGKYLRTGSFDVLDKAIESGQKWRIANDLAPATIMTIGIENTDMWSVGVKRPDNECQAWLKKIGEKYNGGYFLVKTKTKISSKVRFKDK